MKPLTHLYDRFTPTERVQLLLAALARGDELELGRLQQTCPWKFYRQRDAAYTDLWDACERMASIFVIMWLDAEHCVMKKYLALCATQLAIQTFERGFGIGIEAAKQVPDKSHSLWKESDEVISHYYRHHEELEKDYRKHAAILKGLHDGLLRFCCTVAIEPEQLLAWFPPVLEEIKQTLTQLPDDIVSDDGTANAAVRTFSRLWP